MGCEVSEEEFCEGFDFDINNWLVYYDFFRDFFNWLKIEEVFFGGLLGVLRVMCKRIDFVFVIIVFDLFSWLLFCFFCIIFC